MTSPASGRPAATYSDYVFDRLRTDIVAGAMQPATRLAMKALTARYGVGLSPIREALQRLVGEGLVQFTGQRGFRVAPISLEDLEDLTTLRLLVEETAVRQALVRGDDRWEAQIVTAFHLLERHLGRFKSRDEESLRQFDEVHRSFHVALYAGVVSPRIAALHASLFDQAFRYRKFLHGETIPPEDFLAEHRQLMKLALSRDADAAIQALRQHLDLTRQTVRQRLEVQARERRQPATEQATDPKPKSVATRPRR